jgi:hypothetical protein
LAFDTEPVVFTWGGSGEEFEKRLAALLLRAPAALMIDNANGIQIHGDLLESIITEGCADIRPLGHSEMVKVRNRSFNALTGNNPTITETWPDGPFLWTFGRRRRTPNGFDTASTR